MKEPPEFRCWWPWKGEGGAKAEVGVNAEALWVDEAPVVAAELLFLRLAISKGWISPSSPGSKERVEQNPSDDVMSSVRPSLDLKKEFY